jgi:hypothetical protein
MAKADFKKIAIVKKYWTRGVNAPSLRNIATAPQSLEETMSIKIRIPISLKTAQEFLRWMRLSTLIPAVCLLFPIAALAQGGSPFDTGFTSIQTLFTGTIAKVDPDEHRHSGSLRHSDGHRYLPGCFSTVRNGDPRNTVQVSADGCGGEVATMQLLKHELT